METTDQKIKRPKVTILEFFLAVVLLLVFFRLLAVGFLLLAVMLYALYPLHRHRRWFSIAYIAFCVSLLLPVDIDVAGFHGSHYGIRKSGPRFVRLVKGMTNTQRCIEKYGEFITGGCVGIGLEPRWIFVWD